MTTALQAAGLYKRFGAYAALRGLSFEVAEKEIYGLIGPDGAGKTTAMRILAGLVLPDRGSVHVGDFDLQTDLGRARPLMGYMAQQYSLYGDLSVVENFRFFARMQGVRGHELVEREQRLLSLARLEAYRDRPAAALSGGMYKKLALSAALAHRPRLVLLDEPTNGVDPVSRRELWAFLHELVAEGVAVVISTPYMDEAERCDRVGLLFDGQLVAEGDPRAMRENLQAVVYEISATPQAKALAALRQLSAVDEAYTFGKKLHALSTSGADLAAPLHRALSEAGATVTAIARIAPSFEDVFLHTAREAEAKGGAIP